MNESEAKNKLLDEILGKDEFALTANCKLNSIMSSYCTEENTDFALSLIGDWGCGKTYYIKNELKNLIQKKTDLRFIYISLNGVSNFAEIKKRIIIKAICSSSEEEYNDMEGLLDCAASFPYLDKFIEPVIKLKEFSEEKIAKCMDYKKLFIVFDDKERVSPEANIVDILGQIYENYIIKGAKVLFVLNEEKIEEQGYHSTKEKFIQRILSYKPDFLPQVKNFIRNQYHPDTIKKYFSPNMDLILNSFAKLEKHNLRTIKFILNNYIIVIDNIEESLISKCSEFLFKNIMILSNEFKEGEISIKNIEDRAELNTRYNSWLTPKEKAEDEKTYADKFYEKYNKKLDLGFIYVDSIFKFILTGYLDVENLQSKLEMLFDDKGKKERNLIGEFSHFQELEEEELKSKFNELITLIEKGTFFINELPHLYSMIRFIDNHNYFSTKEYDYRNIFLEKAFKNAPEGFSLMHISGMTNFLFEGRENDELLSKINSKVEDFKNKKQNEDNKKEIEDFLKKLNDDYNYSDAPLGMEMNLLNKVVDADCCTKFIELSNKGIRNIETIIHIHILRVVNAGEHNYEQKKNTLEQIAITIESEIESKKIKGMKEKRLKELVVMLKKALKHLENTRKC